MSGKPLPLSELDACAREVQRAQMSARVAQFISEEGDAAETTDGSTAADHARLAAESATDALRRLRSLGAEIPNISGTPARSPDVPLHLLDTPAMRRLLAALEIAVVCAEEVDKERGWLDDDGTPAGYADSLGAFVAKVQTEMFGPASRE